MQDATRITWELEQRRLIGEVLVDYSVYVDRNDPETLVQAVFAENGVFELGSRHAVVGRDNLRMMFAKTLAAFTRTSHHLSNVRVVFDSDTSAQSTAYVYAWHLSSEDGRRMEVWGRYSDRMKLTDVGWRIANRRLTVVGSEGWADPPFELAERYDNPVNAPSPVIARI
ncbi:MAG: nuclear transport factor 2 family protein [Rhizobiaceae bacterium]|nr:nuclear transport factor 2 family protein [Rhizobiaceae bacterium]